MVTEKDLALLDSYLSNELEGQARTDFEKRLGSDASLKSEYKLQKELIEGIRQARVAELKTMLNQTPIPPSSSTGAVAAKVSLWILAAGVVVGGLYYYLKDDGQPAGEHPAITMEQPAATAEQTPAEQPAETQPETPAVKDEPAKVNDATRTEKPAAEPAKKADTGETKTGTATGVRQPELNLYDPTEEMADNREKPEPVQEGSSAKVTGSTIPVEIEEGSKKFNFHYQFKDGKLFLYGSFEKELYEILEFFNNNKRTVFLYYNTNYYLLDETQAKPTPLKAISDQVLLRKLQEYREGQ